MMYRNRTGRICLPLLYNFNAFFFLKHRHKLFFFNMRETINKKERKPYYSYLWDFLSEIQNFPKTNAHMTTESGIDISISKKGLAISVVIDGILKREIW